MSILYSTKEAHVVDCETAFSRRLMLRSQRKRLRRGEFNVNAPYYTVSSVRAGQKRKRPHAAEIQTEEWHECHARPFLSGLLENMTDLPAVLGDKGAKPFLPHEPLTDPIDFPSLVSLAEASTRFSFHEDTATVFELPEDDEVEMEPLDVFHRIISNPSQDKAGTLSLNGHMYLVPPQSTFLLGSLHNGMDDLVQTGPFDLVVMDPPWPNKSAHRSSQYETQDIYDFYQIPLPSLIKPGGLVAVWVTNKPKFRRFVTDKLFKAWHVDLVGIWYWLKTTTKGESVVPLDSPHRKPYEQLVLGIYNDPNAVSSTASHQVEETKAIISVPSCRHSRKPPLEDVLAEYLPNNAKRLELFARCLLPGWTSWGNECLKFQQMQYFEDDDDEPPIKVGGH